MKRIIFIILGCIHICLAHAQNFNGQYISEWQWDMNKNTNHERSKDCIVFNFRLLINQNVK